MEIQRKARKVQLRILIYILLIFSCGLISTNATGTNVDDGECKSIHIRNDLRSFQQLKHCRRINGALTIALVASNNTKNYENLTFPLLTEVTDYLLFFRVTNLTSLSKLFPNLRVIRGRETVSDYALIIYENLHLQRIDLPNLTDILRGSVRIEGNPSLCYAYTVNWDGICKQPFGRHFIKYNNKQCNDRCPDHCQPWAHWPSNYTLGGLDGDEATEFGAVNNRTLFCWNSQDCHESCVDRGGNNLIKGPNGKCCSPFCAGGCYVGDKPDECISCRNVLQDSKCLSICDQDRYEHKGKCLRREECERGPDKKNPPDPCISSRQKAFKAIRVEGTNRCQAECPPQFEEDPDDPHKCKACDKGKCRKVCTPPSKEYRVTDVNSLKTLSHCNVIDGSLVIQMKGGKNIVTELEKTFQDLEEISGYLTITRTESILTLNFLRNLKFINGSVIDGRAYAFSIINNPNLQELFTLDKKDTGVQKKLHIRGKLFIQSNPKLCPYKIESLKQYANVDLTEDDISGDNNGDKEACSTDKLDVELATSSSHFAMIKVEDFTKRLHDARNLLYYLVNYREVSAGNITMFDGRDACGGDVWLQLEETPKQSTQGYQEAILDVKPATRYALYVKTFTIRGAPGALSDMIYFETAPDQPGIPRELRISQTSPGSLTISWSPPSQPGGKIVHYTVTVKKVPDVVDLQDIDFCGSIIGRDAITRKISQAEPEQNNYGSLRNSTNATMPSPDSNCNKEKPDAKPDADAHEVRVTFQDTIIDIVYLKNSCQSPSHSQNTKIIKKRSIQQGSTELDNGNNDNSLPRKSINLGQLSRSPITNMRSLVPQAILFNRSSYKTEEKVNVSHGELSAVITGLDHFSLYEIEVVACHGEFNGGPKVKVSTAYNKCGLNAITQGRTKAIPENDKVNATSIIFYPGNETNADRITWDKPQNPNGLALAFRVRYKLKNANQDVWKEVCIDNSAYEHGGGLPLSNILPGLYVLSVQTISMYTDQRLWSDEIEFTIAQTNVLSPLAWTFLIIASLLSIAMAVAGGAYYSHKKAREDLVYASVNPDYVQYNPDEWEVDKSKLNVEAQIGTGSFGTVYKGQLITEKGKRDCAVKTVPPTSTAKQRFDFLREASIMKQFDTFHVVKLLGVVSVTTPVYVIMEYMENGDLKDFLRKQRDVHQKQGKVLVDGIYLMAAQIADGMAYLASKKFVHRDLAARNCMVGENRIVKVGDFGLTRDIYANDYYRRDTQGRLPVRWMAPESLSDNICTSASDIWSYGIVLWEIVTFSASPYQGLSNDEVIKRVIQGYTMPRPEHCTDKLFNIMERCWRKNDKDRPTFLDIVEYLLPETEGKLYPNCYYRKPKADGDSVAHTIPDDSNNGTESYPLLSWPSSHRANGLTNGDNHVMNHNHHSSDHNGGK